MPQPSLERCKGLPHPGARVGNSENKKVEKVLYSKEKTRKKSRRNIYDINNINNDINDRDKLLNEFNYFSLTKEEFLARDLARELNDAINLGFYLSVVKRYPEYLLRKTLSQVKQIPKSKIKKSKGALFNYLIQKHE